MGMCIDEGVGEREKEREMKPDNGCLLNYNCGWFCNTGSTKDTFFLHWQSFCHSSQIPGKHDRKHPCLLFIFFHSISGFNEVYDALYNVRVFLLATWLPTNFSLCFINHLLEDIMSFCTSWIITPGIMVLCGKSKFSSVQLLSAIWNKNYWPVQNKCQKGRLLWHKNTHCRIGSHQSPVMNCPLTEGVCRVVH